VYWLDDDPGHDWLLWPTRFSFGITTKTAGEPVPLKKSRPLQTGAPRNAVFVKRGRLGSTVDGAPGRVSGAARIPNQLI
jgi:hypothetical protein